MGKTVLAVLVPIPGYLASFAKDVICIPPGKGELVDTLGLYWGYIGVILGLCRGYV